MMKRRKLANDTQLAALLTSALRQVVHDLDELDDLDAIEWAALKRDAAHGRALHQGRRSDVTDAELEAAMMRAVQDFAHLKAKERFRRVGIAVGLSGAQVQRRWLRLRKTPGRSE